MAIKTTIGKKRDGRDRAPSKWVPDPEIFHLVQLAWKLRAAGKGYAEITAATGGKVYKSKNSWASFFDNRTYLGLGKCGQIEIPNHHEPAVSVEDWEKVQALRRDHKNHFQGIQHPRRVRYPALLSGLCVCGKCGAKLIHHSAYKARPWSAYYICGTRDRRHGLKSCDMPSVSARPFDQLVVDTAIKRILTPEVINDLLEETRRQLTDLATLTEELHQKRARLSEIRRAISNLLELAESFGARSAFEKTAVSHRSELDPESPPQAQLCGTSCRPGT
jgi:hypothetical protein